MLIVGAGPAGAALAWMLGRSGLQVTLLDQQGADPANPIRPPFRGEALMPSGLKALEAMGLDQVLRSIPRRPLIGWRMQVDGKSLFFAPEPWGGPLSCTLVPQEALLEALLDRCLQLDGVRVELGRTVSGLLLRSDGVVEGVRLEDGQCWKAQLVVAADGRASRLRRLAGLELEPAPGPGLIVDWFTLDAGEPAEPSAVARAVEPAGPPGAQPLAGTSFLSVIGGGELFSLFGSARGDRNHLALVREPQDAEPARGEQLAGKLAALAPDDLAATLRQQGKAFEHPVSLQVQVGQARPWHRPGFLLLGDAAHPMSPVRAQGLNMALRDALVAGRLLAGVLAAGEAPPRRQDLLNRALAAIEDRRRPEITAMQRLQAQETRRGLLLRRQPLLRALLAAAAPWLGPRLRHHWMNDQLTLRLGLDDLSDDGMTPAAPMDRSTPPSSALVLALLLSAAIPGALAKAPPVPDPPTTEDLRTIQLAAQVCARDNTEASCSSTRQLADPLLDHGGVSASCKDSVYELVQRAKVGDATSYGRRERIEKAAGDVLQFCRPRTRVVGDGSSGNGKPAVNPASPFSLRGEPQQTP